MRRRCGHDALVRHHDLLADHRAAATPPAGECVVLTALILICVAGAADCTRTDAATVIRVPEQFASPIACLLHGQAYLAETALAADLRERVKIVCARS
jgi:hypothetical protein